MKVETARTGLTSPALHDTTLAMHLDRRGLFDASRPVWKNFVSPAVAQLQEEYFHDADPERGARHRAVLDEVLLRPPRQSALAGVARRFDVKSSSILATARGIVTHVETTARGLALSLPPALTRTPLQQFVEQLELRPAQSQALDVPSALRQVRREIETAPAATADLRRAAQLQRSILDLYFVAKDPPSLFHLAEDQGTTRDAATAHLRTVEQRLWRTLGEPGGEKLKHLRHPPALLARAIDEHRTWPAERHARLGAQLARHYRTRKPPDTARLAVLQERVLPPSEKAMARAALAQRLGLPVDRVQRLEDSVVKHLEQLGLEASWPEELRGTPLAEMLTHLLRASPHAKRYALWNQLPRVADRLVQRLRERAQGNEAQRAVLEQHLLSHAPAPLDASRRKALEAVRGHARALVNELAEDLFE